MLTVSGRSSPFPSVGESSLCDIVYVYRANLSQHRLCKVRVLMVEVRQTGSGAGPVLPLRTPNGPQVGVSGGSGV